MSLSYRSVFRAIGMAFMPEIPVDWKLLPLKAVATCNDDVIDESTSSDVEIEYVEISDVDAARGITSRTRLNFGEAPSRARRRVKDGDVILSTVRTYLRAIVALTDPPANLVVSTGFAVVRPQSIQSGYLGYALRHEGFLSEVVARSVGVSYPAINASDVMRIHVPIPSDSEQSLITAFLDRETGKIDALVAEQERLIALLKEKRQALISHAVTKGLDPNVPMKESGVEWLGQLPAHWEVKRIHHVCKLESGHTPSKQVPDYWRDCDIPWVSLADTKQLAVNDYIAETSTMINALGLANSSARVLPAGSVVFTRDASVGLAAITARPMAVSQHLVAWCPSAKVDAIYLLRVINTMRAFLDSHTFGATLKTIGMDDVKSLKMPLPPLAEQVAIVDFVASGIGRIDALVAEAQLAKQLLLERRITVISAAVTGKIDVRGLS